MSEVLWVFKVVCKICGKEEDVADDVRPPAGVWTYVTERCVRFALCSRACIQKCYEITPTIVESPHDAALREVVNSVSQERNTLQAEVARLNKETTELRRERDRIQRDLTYAIGRADELEKKLDVASRALNEERSREVFDPKLLADLANRLRSAHRTAQDASARTVATAEKVVAAIEFLKQTGMVPKE